MGAKGATVGLAILALAAGASPAAGEPASVSPALASTAVKDAGSLQLRQRGQVYAEPSKASERIGRLPRKSRIPITESVDGKGCKRGWLPVPPRGYVCARTRKSLKPAIRSDLPRLEPGRVLPGAYGRLSKSDNVLIFRTRADVVAGNGEKPDRKMDMRLKKRVRIDGKRYWRTASGFYVETVHVRELAPSRFAGLALSGATTLPVAWARPVNRGAEVMVRAEPGPRATVVAQLPPKSPVDPLELSSDGRYVRIAPDQWIERRETRIARKSSPPPQVAKGEVWVDIDLDEQVIVVYRDLTPVYATMISTGIRKRRTPTGTFRITKKVAVQSMYSTPSSTDQYKVADVPWIMSFSKVYALHGAYWHDRFGGRRSHGCINLSPRDARAIYQLVSPAVPAGWMEARATSQEPGSVVRIRSSRR